MERLGSVGHLFIGKPISRGSEHIDFVMIQGGVTAEGRRALTENSGESSSALQSLLWKLSILIKQAGTGG